MLNLPRNLQILRAEGCRLRTWPVLPPTILECYLSGNHFLSLPDLSSYANLIVLELADNSIPEIVNPLPPRLARLNLDCNALRHFNASLVPPTCSSISTYSNPVDFYTPRPVRPTRNPVFEDEPPRPATVYQDQHNVHDSGLQKSTKANIQYLVNYKPDVPENRDLWNTIDRAYADGSWRLMHKLKRLVSASAELPGAILKSYAQNPYIMHGVMFQTFVDRIWLRISDESDAEKKKELVRRFKEEVDEGNGHCTNGMMSRLANVFIGFDENVTLKLNFNQLISARISASQNRFRKTMNAIEGSEPTAFWVAVYKETVKDLVEFEAEDEQYVAWLPPIAEIVLDDLFQSRNGVLPSLRHPPPKTEETDETEPPETVYGIVRDAGLNGYEWELAYICSKRYSGK